MSRPEVSWGPIRDALAQAGASGLSWPELHARTGVAQTVIGATLTKRIASADVFRAGPRRWMRYFLDEGHADLAHPELVATANERRRAWARASIADGAEIERQAARLQRAAAEQRRVTSAGQALPARPEARPAPVTVALPQDQLARSVIEPGKVKPQRVKTAHFDPRYQVDPKTRVVGGFASLGIGRYLDEAPR